MRTATFFSYSPKRSVPWIRWFFYLFFSSIESSSSSTSSSFLSYWIYLNFLLFLPVLAILFVHSFILLYYRVVVSVEVSSVTRPLIQDIFGLKKKLVKEKAPTRGFSRYYSSINARNSSSR